MKVIIFQSIGLAPIPRQNDPKGYLCYLYQGENTPSECKKNLLHMPPFQDLEDTQTISLMWI